MAFTYSLSTDIGKVRLKISDTVSTAYAFEDDEITAMLTEGGTVTAAVILALRSLLISRALRVKRASLPGVSYDDTAQIEGIRLALSLYGGELPTVSIVSPAVNDMDSGFTDPA